MRFLFESRKKLLSENVFDIKYFHIPRHGPALLLPTFHDVRKMRISYISDIKPTCLRWNIWRSTISGVKNSHSPLLSLSHAETHPTRPKLTPRELVFVDEKKCICPHWSQNGSHFPILCVPTLGSSSMWVGPTWLCFFMYTVRSGGVCVPRHYPRRLEGMFKCTVIKGGSCGVGRSQPPPAHTSPEDGADIVLKEIVRHDALCDA